MLYQDFLAHAKDFGDFIEANASDVHKVLRKYESKQVVDDEIKRSVEALRGLSEIQQYFLEESLAQNTASFLPLNLPLYSFVIFGAMPAYQSVSLTIRTPERMREGFEELAKVLSLQERYPNIHLFEGSRERFVDEYCKKASVVIFTGKRENFARIQRACSTDTLLLYNGVGHNPLIITPSADMDLAVRKTLHVKLFNNGQDCAGPDNILVHSLVVEIFMEKLLAELSKVKCNASYADEDVVVGPLFEISSLQHVVDMISNMRRQGAYINYGGQVDLLHNIVYPCVVRTTLKQLQNFREMYSPIFLVTEYEHDRELALYFDDPGSQYQSSEMYISLFGESDYVAGVKGSIILKNCTIHDVEKGLYEFGGYSPGASQVSCYGVQISKPLLIPREIRNFLGVEGKRIFTGFPRIKDDFERQIVSAQFQENVRQIFGDELFFAYIFGSFVTRRDKRYADVDTLVCVKNRNIDQVKKYLEWLFLTHEMFGRIPDFKYPAEVVTVDELQAATASLPTLELSAKMNSSTVYDAMIWCHSLSQPWLGALNPENVPQEWKQLFTVHGHRLLRSFLDDLEKIVLAGDSLIQLRPEIYEIPRKEPEVSRFISNLKGRGLLNMLNMIPFEERPAYSDIMLRLVSAREFIGKHVFKVEHLYNPYFRFGVVDFPGKE